MILDRLKQETTLLHKEVEKDNLTQFIMDGSITQDQYEALLRQNFVIYKGVEDFINARYDMLPDDLQPFAGFEKTNRLAKDILSFSNSPLPTELKVVGSHNLPSIIGKLYVVEGSMMGGMMIAKKLENCKNLRHIKSHSFFNRNNAESRERWSALKKVISDTPFSNDEISIAVESAKDTFLLFQDTYSSKIV